MKRPFLHLAIFLIIGLLSGQYTDFLPYTALLAVLIIGFRAFKNKNIVFLLPLASLVLGLTVSFLAVKDPVFENDTDVSVKCVVTNINFTQGGRQRLFAKTSVIAENGGIKNTEAKILIYTPKGEFVHKGDIIFATGKSVSMEKPTVKGGFDMGKYIISKNLEGGMYAKKIYYMGNNGKVYFLDNLKEKLHNIYFEIFPEKEAQIVCAMVLGEGSLVSDDTREFYSSAGISHVLAVSGLHTAAICLAVRLIFKRILGKRKSAAAAMVFAALYAVFTGCAPSVVRAVIMVEIVLLADVLYRQGDTLNSLCAAVFFMALYNPFIIYDVGFLLSVSSVYACVLCGKIFEKEDTVLKKILSLAAVSFMVSVVTLPICAINFYTVSFAGVFANIFVIPLLMPLLLLAFVCGILGAVNINIGIFIGGSVYVILKIFEFVSFIAAKLPLANIHTGNLGLIFAFLYYILIILLVQNKISQFKTRILILADLAAVFVLLLGNRFIYHKNYMDFIDVGQGDCMVLRTYDGGVYVFDTGGYVSEGENTGKKIVLPYLDYYGKSKVDALFISHPDNDHCGGAEEIIRGTKVENIVVADYPYEESELYSKIYSAAKDTKTDILYIKGGQSAEIGGECEILCLYPLYTEKTEISDNSGSLVLKIVCGEKSFLLTGDIGADDEEKLILLNAPIKCDVLKTAHHGSKYSTSEEFVEKINADYAVISYGKNNRYGHPSAEVKQRLENNGIIIYETAADGTITAETDGKTLKFYTSAKEEKKWRP